MIFLDSDIFIIDLRYRRDLRYEKNAAFLLEVKRRKRQAVTSIFNLLEVCGILSFNLNEQQLIDLFYHLPTHYAVQVVPKKRVDEYLPRVTASRLLQIMSKKASFGDALVIWAVQSLGNAVSQFVSWNARHFVGHLPIPALTPEEALESGI